MVVTCIFDIRIISFAIQILHSLGLQEGEPGPAVAAGSGSVLSKSQKPRVVGLSGQHGSPVAV